LINGFGFVLILLIPNKYVNIHEVNVLKAIHGRNIPEVGGTGDTNLNVHSPFSAHENERREVSLLNAVAYLCGNFPYLAIIAALTGLFFVISGI
jgi:hypothetical protein